MRIIRSMRNVAPKGTIDSVKESKKNGGRAFDILMEAQTCWDNMDDFRRSRERCKQYAFGDQWGDVIVVDGKKMTEEEYIRKQGNIPLKNNLISNLIDNVVGTYRKQDKEPVCHARARDGQKLSETMSTVLQYNQQVNRMKEIYAKGFKEFLISGLVVLKKRWGYNPDTGTKDVWSEEVDTSKFFVDNNWSDLRGWGIACIGETHDYDLGTVLRLFAHTQEDADRLTKIYSYAKNKSNIVLNCEAFGMPRQKNWDFLWPDDPTRCRVIEVWRKETKPRYLCHDYNDGSLYKIEVEDYAEQVEAENAARIKQGTEAGMDEADIPLIKAEWFVDNYWYYYFLSPFGDILDEGETQYEHKSHPYVMKAYPFIDGEIHSFVSNVLDQQRYINRLVTLYDWIMRASAKGVLLVPVDSIPDGMDINDFAEVWSRFNGVVAVKTKPGVPLPSQIANNSTNVGIQDLLQVQLRFFEDISGVHGALQGKPGYAGTSASLYAQQTQNATTSLLDILEVYGDFVVSSANKDVKMIKQFYPEEVIIGIAGGDADVTMKDAQRVKDIDYDLSIAESPTTPAYRTYANDFLMQIWSAGQINLQQLLENGDFPFADRLLQSIKAQQEQMQQQQAQQAQQAQALQAAQQPQPQQGTPRAPSAQQILQQQQQ